MPIKNTSDATFQADVLEAKLPTIVDFWAPWCGPCKSIAPELEKLQKQYEGKIQVMKHNVDDEPLTPVNLYIRSIPTILFYPGKGASPAAMNGAASASEISRKFRLEEVVS